MAGEGLVTIESKFGPEDSAARLKAEIEARGLTLFAVVDHARNAREAGLSLRPAVVLIFGNAKGGTPLMQAEPTMGIDLPLKGLIWEDAAGKTWISYADPLWLAHSHGLRQSETDELALSLRRGLDAVVKGAAGAA